MNQKSCDTCVDHIGAGECRSNLERECSAGGGFEAWRPKTIFMSVAEAAEYMDDVGYTGNCDVRKRDDGLYELRMATQS